MNRKERAIARLREAERAASSARLRYGSRDYRAVEAREWVEEERQRLATLGSP